MIVFVVNTPIFSFVCITRSEIEFCFYFFVMEGAVTFLNNSMLSLDLLLVLVLMFGSHRGDFGWLLLDWGRREDS